MAAIRHVPCIIAKVRRMVEEEGKTHAQVSLELRSKFPGVKGFKCASVKRLCLEEDIHRTSRLHPSELDTVVRGAVTKVCTEY